MFGRPEGGFAKTEVSHYGVGAWCCYNSVEYEIRKHERSDTYSLFVFGQLEGKDEHMNNYTEVFMTREQVLELIKYLEKRVSE